MHFLVLGNVEVAADGVCHAVGGPKQRAVLALLISESGRPVSTDRLIDGVYGDDAPGGARRSIQTYVSNLRGELGDVIESEGSGYILKVDRDAVDAARFEDAVSLAGSRGDDPEGKAALLRDALALWRGHPYADIEVFDGLAAEVARLNELRLTAIEERIDADLELGRHHEIVAEVGSLTTEYPLRERLRSQEMLALYRCGRQAEALRVYDRTRTYLVEELGLDPSPELRRLQEQILDQDPALTLDQRPAIRDVAVLVADVDDPRTFESLNPEQRDEIVAAQGFAVEQAVATAGGELFAHRGSAMYAAFADVAPAVAAADSAQRALTGEGSAMRMAITVGEVESDPGEMVGPPVTRAASLVATAHGGQVLVSAEAHEAIVDAGIAGWSIRSLGSHDVDGGGGFRSVYQLLIDGLLNDFPALRVGGTPPGLPTGARGVPGYELREPVGSGAFGVVHRAYQPSVGREVAVKIIRPEYANHPEFIRRFEVEAQLVARLEHPHIVPLHDYWRQPDGAFLVMRWLRGGSLAQRLADRALSNDEVVRLLSQIGPALDHAHRHGVAHRDVKPSNVLFDDDDNAYLSDFGIATVGAHAGGVQADVAALGSLIVRCLGASEPTPALASFLDRALSVDAGRRFESVEALVAGWEAAVGGIESALGELRYTPTRNPYKGLQAFGELDAEDFHGRDAEVEQLLDAVADRRLVAVVGPSGVGKSSVVRAGLIPALRDGAVDESDQWLITDLLPGSHPYEELAAALMRVASESPSDLEADLRRDDRGLVRAAKRYLPDGAQLLLVIDQFEELFTLTVDDAERLDFLAMLRAAIVDERSPLRTVVTMRADYFDRPLRFGEFGELLRDAVVPVSAPTAEAYGAIVVEPAAAVGVTFSSGLVDRIVADVKDQPGALPLLEFSLTELFERRDTDLLTLNAYEASGGVLGALGRRAEQIYAELDDPGHQAARQVFLRLVNVSEAGRDTRRRVRLTELERLGFADATLHSVLGAYGNHRLLTFDRDPVTRGPTVEVAHEAILAEWSRLAAWIAEQREDLLLHGRLAIAVADWEASGQSEPYLLSGGRLALHEAWTGTTELTLTSAETDFLHESRKAENARVAARRRRRRLVMGGFGVAAVIALLLAVAAVLARNDATEQAELAEAQAGLAEAQAELAMEAAERAEVATLISRSGEISADEPLVSVLLALEANRRAPGPETEQTVLNAMSELGTLVATFEPFPSAPRPSIVRWLSPDAMSLSTSVDGLMYRQSLVSGEVVEVGPLPVPDAAWVGDEAANRRFAHALDLSTFWFGPYDGAWEVELQPEETMQLIGDQGRGGKVGTLAANRLVFASFDGTYVGDGVFEVRGEPLRKLVLLDATTGETVGPGIEGVVGPRAVLSADGKLIAVRSQPSSVVGPNGAIFVIDAETGVLVKQIELDNPEGTVTASGNDNTGGGSIAFDTDAGELLAGVSGGRLVTIDLDSGDVVAEVQTNVTSDIIDVDLRSDGRVVVVSNGLAELVDRRRGPIPGSGIEMRDAVQGVMRPDDTLLITASDLRLDVHEFDGAALVEQAVDLEAGTDVALGFGNAALLQQRGSFDRLDLASGERTAVGLAPAFIPMSLDEHGVLVFSIESLVGGRWVDGQLTDRMKTVSSGSSPLLGTFAPDRSAGVALRPDGAYEVTLVDTRPGEVGPLITVVESDDTCTAYPAPGDGLHVMLCSGTLRTYDSSGAVTGEVSTGLLNLSLAKGDQASGLLAFGGPDGRSPVVVIDPASGDWHMVPDSNQVANFTFARDGKLLAILELDGTLRLWDVDRQESTGVLWDGAGAGYEEPLWYEDSTDSLWLSTPGRMVQLPLSPQRWLERACHFAGRGFTEAEWERYVPGDEPLQSACS